MITTWLSLIFVSGMSIYFIFGLGILVIAGFSSLIFLSPEKFNYILSRITSFIDPSKGDGFSVPKKQLMQSDLVV